jgi:beta-lactamase class A
MIFRATSLLMILIGIGLGVFAYEKYRQAADIFPAGTTWGGVEVGGLSREAAEERVRAAYVRPIELRYQGAAIQAGAEDLGLRIAIITDPNLSGISFWDYQWNRPPRPMALPLELEVDEDVLRAYLTEQVATRYDSIPPAPLPLAGDTRFELGQAGSRLDVDASVESVAARLRSLGGGPVDLAVNVMPPAAPDLKNLEIFLKQKIDLAGFDGIVEISLADFKTDRSLQFAYRAGQQLEKDIAFSAASTVKIPIMISVLRRLGEPIPAEIDSLVMRMMALSENPPADRLMEEVIGGELAPLSVTEDMRRLGLENTFLAGYFYLGAPLLQVFETPANRRQDVTTSPDIYNQTTAGDMTALLQAVYQCAVDGSGLLVESFPGEMTASKCKYLLGVMAQNKIGVLFEAGVPEGTRVAHKHGWTEESDGYLHSISDVGIVFGQETDYLLIVFLYDRDQLIFDPANKLIAQLSQVVYNYFNPNHQIPWMFGPIDYR